MNISVSGKNMDTGSAFQVHAETALNDVINKYFDRAVSGHVTLEKSDAGFRVKTRVALSRRIELEATGYAHDAHAALEAAIEHAEKRLRRHKRRLKNHRGTVTATEEDDVLPVPMMVYASAEQADDLIDGEDLPAVVAELAYDIEMLTVEQAVMKLELSESPMLMFRNARISVSMSFIGVRTDRLAGSTRVGRDASTADQAETTPGLLSSSKSQQPPCASARAGSMRVSLRMPKCGTGMPTT